MIKICHTFDRSIFQYIAVNDNLSRLEEQITLYKSGNALIPDELSDRVKNLKLEARYFTDSKK